jgi:hypothetical protein
MNLIHHATTPRVVIRPRSYYFTKQLGIVLISRVTYDPMMVRDHERIANLNHINDRNHVEVVQMFWMGRAPLFEFVKRFRKIGLLQDSIHISVEDQICMFLRVVAHKQRFGVIQVMFTRFLNKIYIPLF